jgi:glycerol-3-phosphate dehydrogenase
MAGTAYADPATSAASMAEAFLAEAQAAFPWAGLLRERLVLVHDGLVPGDARALWSHSQVIDHAIEGAPGLVSALGAKYTTARAVAERAVNAVFRRLERTPPPSRSARTPLPGARLPVGEPEEQARRAVRDEMARSLEDVVLRRLELGALGRPDPALLARVTTAAAEELSWDAPRLDEARRGLEACWPAKA